MSLWAICQDIRNEDEQSTYHRILRFIENELHIKLLFYQKMTLKYMLDDNIQKRLQEMYEEKQEK